MRKRKYCRRKKWKCVVLCVSHMFRSLSLQEDISLDTTATPVLGPEDLRMQRQLTGAVMAGARNMWGFKPSQNKQINKYVPRV